MFRLAKLYSNALPHINKFNPLCVANKSSVNDPSSTNKYNNQQDRSNTNTDQTNKSHTSSDHSNSSSEKSNIQSDKSGTFDKSTKGSKNEYEQTGYQQNKGVNDTTQHPSSTDKSKGSTPGTGSNMGVGASSGSGSSMGTGSSSMGSGGSSMGSGGSSMGSGGSSMGTGGSSMGIGGSQSKDVNSTKNSSSSSCMPNESDKKETDQKKGDQENPLSDHKILHMGDKSDGSDHQTQTKSEDKGVLKKMYENLTGTTTETTEKQMDQYKTQINELFKKYKVQGTDAMVQDFINWKNNQKST